MSNQPTARQLEVHAFIPIRTVNFGDERLPERFWSKCMPEPMSGCWLWIAGLQAAGYAIYRGSSNGHRCAYQTLVGDIGVGLELDHLCRVRCCVNPGHLEAVTPRVNVLRSESTAALNAKKTHCPNGHPFEQVMWGGRAQRVCRPCNREATKAAQRRKRLHVQ